jgi:hypothetical protein
MDRMLNQTVALHAPGTGLLPVTAHEKPYDWQWMFAFLSARAVAGIETFHEDQYTRSFSLDGHRGLIKVFNPRHRTRAEKREHPLPVIGRSPG